MNCKKLTKTLAVFLSAAALLSALPITTVAALEERKIKPSQSESSDLSTDTEQTSKPTAKGKSFTVKSIKQVAKSYNVAPEFLDEIDGKKSVSLEALKKYAIKYNLPAQFLQRFVSDAFVFKAGSSFQYIPILDNVPLNTYKWSNLKRKSNELKYVQDGKTKSIKGIDVSEFQGDIDWRKVKKDGVDYAFIRLGYRGYGTGVIHMDKYYEQNIEGANAAGVPVGVYFFSQATTTEEAVEEANAVLDNIGNYNVDYPIVFDMEGSGTGNGRADHMSKAQATKVARAFCDTIAEAGYKPMIYSYTKWFVENLDLTKLTKYDKWVAQYYAVPFFPYDFQILQYANTGRVNGIKGNVDMNISFVNYAK